MEILLSMGFSRAVALDALRINNNDIDASINHCLSKATASSDQNQIFKEKITVCSVSQYSFSEFGASACTPISCCMLSKLLGVVDPNCREFNEEELMTDAVLTGVQLLSEICHTSGADSQRHWSCDEFLDASAVLKSSLIHVGSSQHVIGSRDVFRSIIQNGRENADNSNHRDEYVGIVITKPPETICLCIPPSSCKPWYMYDPHSRPQLGISGSYLIVADDQEIICNRLNELFPSLSSSTFAGDSSEDDLMSLMYNSIEATFFVCVSSTTMNTNAPSEVVDSSPLITTIFDSAMIDVGANRERADSTQVVDDFVIVDPTTPDHC